MKRWKPTWWIFGTTTMMMTVIFHTCSIKQAVSSQRDQNARLRTELYEATKARDALRDKIDRYNLDVLKAERDSFAGLVGAIQEDIIRLDLQNQEYSEDLLIEVEARIALELAVVELRRRDSLLTLYNADWLVYSSLLEDSLRYYKDQLAPPVTGISPKNYRYSIGGLAVLLLLIHLQIARRKT